MVIVPRLVVAAPASGHGKTTLAAGLLAALRRRGLDVSGHKVGPDYIDPTYHAAACGRPGRNLDVVMCGEELIAPLFLHGARGGALAVVEGVMGLFDGRGATSHGSTAHVARLLDAPVLLVVDAAAQGASIAALVSGFARHDERVRVGGVVLNRVGSDRHEHILRAALAETGVPVLGALRRDAAARVPSRHLGLVPAAERDDATEAIDALAALVAGAVDLDAVTRLARTAGPLRATPWAPPEPDHRPPHRPVVALAGGPAFTFGYPETGELLTAAGADVVTVDPLRDETLPDGCGALVIGGGFPEQHAASLAANGGLRAAVAGLAGRGAPIAAECGGLLYLTRELDGHRMCGVLDATARMTDRLTLGYRQASAAADSVLAPMGAAVTGHEFHRTRVTPGTGEAPAWRVGGRREGFVRGNVHASYLHLHWTARPEIARRLVARAA